MFASGVGLTQPSVLQAVARWRRSVTTAALCAAVMLVIAAPTHAAERTTAQRFEVTPFVGIGFGGDFEDPVDGSERSLDDDTTFGVIFNIADEPWRHYEILYTKQGTTVDGTVPIDMDVEYLQIGGIVSHPDARLIIPYFGLTLGAARFSPDAPGLDDETKLAFTAGGGVRVPITDHFGLRLDLRAYLTVLDSDGDLFCGANPPQGACSIRAESDTFLQYSASLGVVFAF